MTNELGLTIKRQCSELKLITEWLYGNTQEDFSQTRLLGKNYLKERMHDLQKEIRTNPIWELVNH